MSRHIKPDDRNLPVRADVIAHYEKRQRLATARGDRDTAQFIAARLRDLRSGKRIQLHFNEFPPQYRPAEYSSLFELCGSSFVPVPTWQPSQPRPSEWTM